TAAISGAGHLVDLVVHPQIPVTRNEQGELQQVHAKRPTGTAATVESWMTFAVDRMSETGREELTERLHKVLAYVRDAVTDWAAMRQRRERIARDLSVIVTPTVESSVCEPAE